MSSAWRRMVLGLFLISIGWIGAAADEAPRVLFLLPEVSFLYVPRWLIGQELFAVVDELEANGVIVEYTSPKAGVYAIPLDEANLRIRKIVVEITSDLIDVSEYDIVAIGGGHAHQSVPCGDG